MSKVERSTADSVPRKHFQLDYDELRKPAYLGVRRAAAFLGVGLNATEEYLPQSLALTKVSMWNFFPEPLPEEAGRDAVKEFRIWLVGNALRELDAHFSLFLDNLCFAIRLSKLHGKRIRSDHVVKSISGETNVAKKFSTVMKELEDQEPDAAMLWSLSNARNCLTHSGGLVTARHANSDGVLLVTWLGLESRLMQGEQQIVLPPVFAPIQASDPSKEAFIAVVLVERERRFSIGQKIEFTPNELHEICFYYQRLTDQVVEKLAANLAARGIGPIESLQTNGSVAGQAIDASNPG
jgi:hypothetical protein